MLPEVICELRMPNASLSHIRDNAKYNLPFLKHGTHKGKTVSICGAGPSLKDYSSFEGDVWAVNSALPYLQKKGIRVTHGFTIDQGVEMIAEWSETFGVEYLIATSCNTSLIAHLLLNQRKVSLFHSHLGIEGENELYRDLYPSEPQPDGTRIALRAGHGLNGVPRAVCIALGMGYEQVTVYGADCGTVSDTEMPWLDTPEYEEWTKGLVLYADGRTAFDCYGADSPFAQTSTLGDGKRWTTRPDMIVSAQHLLDMEKMFPGRVTLVGDTLPSAIRGITENLPRLTPEGHVVGFGRSGPPVLA
jgi:hypothetical protein